MDEERHREALARLPLPSLDDVEAAFVEHVRAHQGIDVDELDRRVIHALGRQPGEEAVEHIIDVVADHLVDDLGPLALMAGDRTVHVEDLTAGIVLTHRLGEAEREVASLSVAFDLAGFARRDGLTLPDGAPVDVFSVDPGHVGWMGPDGWLHRFAAGSLLAVRVDGGGVVHLTELSSEPAVHAALVDAVRSAYDREVDEGWLPVSGEDLVLALLLDDRAAFAEPCPPLSDLAAAAGLERRHNKVAHDETVWHNAVRGRRIMRVMTELDDDTQAAREVLLALDVADLLSGVDPAAVPDVEGEVDDRTIRALLGPLADEAALEVLADELFGGEDPDARPRAEAFVEAALGAASRPRERAVAGLLAAVHAERSLQPLVAERHLELAHEADPDVAAVVDRLAWYASDRGDAPRAARLWRRLDPDGAVGQDLEQVERFRAATHAGLGRNSPCWCGSGRKYKHCHLGVTELAPLPERVGWLCRKAVGFLERAGPGARADVDAIAEARAVDPGRHDDVVAAFEDPIVMDLALTEGGWFERFVEERGELLPDDEAMLAQSWLLVDRTVYEVVGVEPGHTLTLQDLRSGDRIDVRERTFSRQTRPGAMVCGRAVPDGETHQLVGGLFAVAPGTERAVLDLLDDGNPMAIADYVGSLHRPPTLQTREGEALVQCEVVVQVDDPAAARAFLDATYDADDADDRWVEMHALNEDERILRARLRLDGTRLSVSTTSEERADRVLTALRAALAGSRVVSDRRTPTDVERLLRQHDLNSARLQSGDEGPDVDSPDVAALLDEVRDRFEQRWCDESIPALGGLTPRQAAEDPTRREELQRLIASFEHDLAVANAVAMRPQRLRLLLGLA